MMNIADFNKWNTEGFHKALMNIINKKQARRRPYYILVIITPDYDGIPAAVAQENRPTKDINTEGKKLIHTKMVVIEQPPLIPMIGTSLWRIDNQRGQARCCYVLPRDKPIIKGYEMGPSSKLVLKSAKAAGSPYVYNKPKSE